MKGSVLKPAADPIRFRIKIGDLSERAPLKIGPAEVDSNALAGVVERLNGYAGVVLPVAVTMQVIPAL